MIQHLKRIHNDDGGASTTEYVLILAFVVLPLGLAVPLMLRLIQVYGDRIAEAIRIPFP